MMCRMYNYAGIISIAVHCCDSDCRTWHQQLRTLSQMGLCIKLEYEERRNLIESTCIVSDRHISIVFDCAHSNIVCTNT